jgi:hypothetical protein
MLRASYKPWILSCQLPGEDYIIRPEERNTQGFADLHVLRFRQNASIGVNFARFGLPIKSFGAVFNTLGSTFSGLLDTVMTTTGYYWVNASWSVSTTPGTFAYTTPNKTRHRPRT